MAGSSNIDLQKEVGVMDVASAVVCNRYSEAGWQKAEGYVPREMEITVYVNDRALVTILCTAAKLDYLVLGYLYAEGIITGMADIARMQLKLDESMAVVTLKDPAFELPTLRKLGCSGSSVYKTQGERIYSDLTIEPKAVLALMEKLQAQMELYPISGGVHTSALADPEKLLVVAEDIGRHNTLNKIQGECIVRGIDTKDKLMLITGRISSEMLLKAAKMHAPIVVSRHAPTKSAILLATEMTIALVGQARGGSLAVFTCPERLGLPQN